MNVGRRYLHLLSVAVVVVLASAASSHAAVTPPSLNLKFEQIARRVHYLRTSGSYALLTLTSDQYELIDDNTGKIGYIRRASGCTFLDMAAPWILFESCPQFANSGWVMLYNVQTRSWKPLKCSVCSTDNFPADTNFALGSHWLWLADPPPCETHGSCSSPIFVSVPSGVEDTWQPSGYIAADVDSPTLQDPVCWPDRFTGVIGPLTSYESPFNTAMVWADKFTVAQVGPAGGSYVLTLEGCSAQPAIPLLTANAGAYSWLITANAHALVWWVSGPLASGIFIPSLQHFTVRLPAGPDPSLLGTLRNPLELTNRRVYLLDGNQRVWAATLPIAAR